jgi:hypothetical protein
MKTAFNAFKEGFFGAFTLAAAIVLAVVSVASAFVSGESVLPQNNSGTHRS